MVHRVWNFSAGPGALPVPVLEHVRDELLAHADVGASVLELSHRSRAFEALIDEAESNLRDLLDVPQTHRILFLQGGASLQFSMVPMNLLRTADAPAAHVLTGSWSTKALAEARKEGEAIVVWDGAASGFTTVPDTLAGLAPGAAYLHVTSNETVEGVELPAGFEPPVGEDPPLVCDASSDFLSRPIPVDRYGLLYAGAQKNAGPAGLTVAIVHEELLGRAPDVLPTMLDYRVHAEHRSLYNTPPTFAVYVLALVTRWLREDVGGLEAMAERNREKAALLYEGIDASGGFYRGHATKEARSRMNVTFHLPSEELERAFVEEAAANDLVELRGHRSVGGIRASIYNAMPLEGVQRLRSFMDGFRSRTA